MRARIIPGGPRRITGDLSDGKCFLDVASIEPASTFGVGGVCTGQAVSLLFELDRRDLARTVRHYTEVEPKLGLNVVTPLMSDDDHPGEIADLVLDEGPKLRRVIDILVDHAIERRLPHGIGATTGGDDRLVECDHPVRGIVYASGFLESGFPEPVDIRV